MGQDFHNWEVDKLSDYIVDTHHVYVRKASAEILEIGKEVSGEFGNAHPELKEIMSSFEELSKAMEDHMTGEEKYLFPYVKKLLVAKQEGNKVPKPGFGSLEGPIKNHYKDHDEADKLMQKINALSSGFALSSDATEEYREFYRLLKEFEVDLAAHIHLENEVLFEKCIQLEKEVVE